MPDSVEVVAAERLIPVNLTSTTKTSNSTSASTSKIYEQLTGMVRLEMECNTHFQRRCGSNGVDGRYRQRGQFKYFT